MNFDDYETLPTTSVSTNMLAGAMAGILEHCVMYPMDSVKTRMQSLTISGETISSTMRNMIKTEGIMRPIRGLPAVVAGAGPAHAFYFASYEYSKEIMSKVAPHRTNVNYITSAVIATLIHDAISTPTDVVKQRMQMYGSPYKSVITATRSIYRQEGVRAFYRSYVTQLIMNLPYQALHFSTYEFFQNMLNHDRKYNPPVHVVAGGAAGAVSSALTTPLDVIKTLLNTQEKGIGLTKGMPDAIRQIYSQAGYMGFFKGLLPRVLYSMPATAICWSTYEFFKFTLTGQTQDEYKSSVSGQNPLKPKETSNVNPPIKIDLPSVDKMGGLASSTFAVGKQSTTSSMAANAVTADVGPPRDGGPLKPRELPAMSGAGMYNALSMNTIHTTDSTVRPSF